MKLFQTLFYHSFITLPLGPNAKPFVLACIRVTLPAVEEKPHILSSLWSCKFISHSCHSAMRISGWLAPICSFRNLGFFPLWLYPLLEIWGSSHSTSRWGRTLGRRQNHFIHRRSLPPHSQSISQIQTHEPHAAAREVGKVVQL